MFRMIWKLNSHLYIPKYVGSYGCIEPTKIHIIYPIYSELTRRGFTCRWNEMIESSNDIDIVFMTNKPFIRIHFLPFEIPLFHLLMPQPHFTVQRCTFIWILLFLIVSGSFTVSDGIVNGNLNPGLWSELEQHRLLGSDK